MADLQSYNAKICYTITGFLIHDNKILLIKHKKAGIWLCPGGHIEENELPHQAVEREFLEETGIKAQAISSGLQINDSSRETVPAPFHMNLHWVCQDNYEHRVHGSTLTQYAKKHWSKGCEMHFGMSYLMQIVGDNTYTQNVEETDGIGWFSKKEASELLTEKMIREEMLFAFSQSV